MVSLTDTLDAVQASLIAAGIGQKISSKAAWMIYKGSLPDSDLNDTQAPAIADEAICLYETPGRPPLEAWYIDYVAFQLRVRSAPDGYTAARQKIQDCYLRLHATESALNAASGAGQWVYCYAMQSGPLPLGMDNKRRIGLVWNFRAMRNRVQ